MWWVSGAAILAILWSALWWSRYLMRASDGCPPRPVHPQADAVFGHPEMDAFGEGLMEYRDTLTTRPCFACGHLPVFHLDPASPCVCCTQTELIDIEID